MIRNLPSKKVYKDNIELKKEKAESAGNTERRKISFPKEQVENTDLYKPVLNKIITSSFNIIFFIT